MASGTITQGGTWGGATSFTKDTTTAGCTTVDVLCVKRTDTTAQTLVAHSIIDTGATNQNATNCSSAANCTFFVRMTTYSDNAYTTVVDTGTMAGATTQLFTVNAAIQEQLTFCIGNTAVNSVPAAIPLCSAISGSSLNLGTLNAGNISVSPVPAATYGGDANNGLAELSTNAVNGTTVAYDASQQSGTGVGTLGTLRVSGAACTAGSDSDQCINAIGVTKAQLTTGTEAFGMAIGGIDCSNVSAYTCTFSSGTFNLVPTANYNCNGIVGGSADTYDPDSGVITGTSSCYYAWDATGTSETIASSSVPVGNEALILKFAATPELTTPQGTYTAKADFVATPTF